MKKLFLSFVLVAFALMSFAQKVHFTDLSNKWKYICASDATPPIYYFNTGEGWKGDTVLNHVPYTYGYDYTSGASQLVCFREDTTVGKVYYYDFKTNTDKIFMDYTAKAKDTIAIASFKLVVNYTSTIVLNGISYIQQSLTPFDSLGHQYVALKIIEGLGCEYGIFYPFQPFAIEPQCRLCEFSNQNQTIRIGNCTLGLEEEINKQGRAIVQPNPINELSIVNFPLVKNGIIIVYDFTGRQVLSEKIINKTSFILDETKFLNGLYSYQIISQNGERCVGRFLKQ
ncbi:MAG: T9SS type A sorting domain-containing protein [Chitinophagaceae bacterium]